MIGKPQQPLKSKPNLPFIFTPLVLPDQPELQQTAARPASPGTGCSRVQSLQLKETGRQVRKCVHLDHSVRFMSC